MPKDNSKKPLYDFRNLFNPLSGPLLAIMIFLLIAGGTMLYQQNIWGLLLFVLGVIMTAGFKQPTDAQPRRVWILTFLGQMTTIIVDQLTLLLDYIPGFKIVGYVEFKLQQVDLDIPLTKDIRCSDGGYVSILVSTSVLPDEDDDPPGFHDVNGEWKSGGQKLRDYANSGGNMEDIKKQLDEILTAWLQTFALTYDSEFMEQHSHEISEKLLLCVTGVEGSEHEKLRLKKANSTLDDTRGLGIKFKKFQVIVKAPQKVVDARNKVKEQKAERESQKLNTETVNEQIIARLRLYRFGTDELGKQVCPPTPPDKIPSLAEIRAMIIQENLEHDGQLTQVINQGGLNITQTPVP